MTIRKTLVGAFLLVSLIPATVLIWIAFVDTRKAMRVEIEQTLLVQAVGVSSDVDKMLFERLQNAITWSHMQVMQEIRVRDIDKRLSAFLSQLKTGYQNVYQNLYCTDRHDRVVASNSPAAIGGRLMRARASAIVALPGGQAAVVLPARGAGADGIAYIRARIPDRFGTGSVGQLVLAFRWRQISEILDQAGTGGRAVAVLDSHGMLVAGSQSLRRRGLVMTHRLKMWLAHLPDQGVVVLKGGPLHVSRVIVGFSRSRGYGAFAGLNWMTLVIEPVGQALLPVHRLAVLFLLLLIATVLIATWVSLWVGNSIARPIVALTAFTRRFRVDKTLPPAPRAPRNEVGELTSAFVETVGDLDRARQNLVRASRFAMMGEMAAVMAHELRTPLGILRSSSQILQKESGLSEDGRELVGFIESETERLNRLVSGMLDSVHPRAPIFRLTDVHGLLHNCVVMLLARTEKSGIRIEESLDSPNPYCECDPEQMTQVFLNLVMNAVQAVSENGRVSVRTRSVPGRLIIEVADNGPGIPEEDYAKIFESLFHKREGGIGLGLVVVQQIVAAHGGDVTVGRSVLGGAAFRVALPMRQGGLV